MALPILHACDTLRTIPGNLFLVVARCKQYDILTVVLTRFAREWRHADTASGAHLCRNGPQNSLYCMRVARFR